MYWNLTSRYFFPQNLPCFWFRVAIFRRRKSLFIIRCCKFCIVFQYKILVCAGGCVCVYAFRIVSPDKNLFCIYTFIIIIKDNRMCTLEMYVYNYRTVIRGDHWRNFFWRFENWYQSFTQFCCLVVVFCFVLFLFCLFVCFCFLFVLLCFVSELRSCVKVEVAVPNGSYGRSLWT